MLQELIERKNKLIEELNSIEDKIMEHIKDCKHEHKSMKGKANHSTISWFICNDCKRHITLKDGMVVKVSVPRLSV